MPAPLLSLSATAEPKTKRMWPAVPRATRTKRKIPAAGRSRYALPSRRIQHREERIIRETEDRREQREARGGPLVPAHVGASLDHVVADTAALAY